MVAKAPGLVLQCWLRGFRVNGPTQCQQCWEPVWLRGFLIELPDTSERPHTTGQVCGATTVGTVATCETTILRAVPDSTSLGEARARLATRPTAATAGLACIDGIHPTDAAPTGPFSTGLGVAPARLVTRPAAATASLACSDGALPTGAAPTRPFSNHALPAVAAGAFATPDSICQSGHWEGMQTSVTECHHARPHAAQVEPWGVAQRSCVGRSRHFGSACAGERMQTRHGAGGAALEDPRLGC